MSLSQGKGLAELKQRLLFLVIALFVFRIGAHIPVPGIDPSKLAGLFRQQTSGIMEYLNMFSGGALQRFTVFALGVMPYITPYFFLVSFNLMASPL